MACSELPKRRMSDPEVFPFRPHHQRSILRVAALDTGHAEAKGNDHTAAGPNSEIDRRRLRRCDRRPHSVRIKGSPTWIDVPRSR